MWDLIIVLIVVAVAAWFVVRRYFKSAGSKQSACGCGCSCGSGGQACEKPSAEVSAITGPEPTLEGERGG